MSNISLYHLTADFAALMDEDDDISSALADIVAGEIEAKAENICKFLTMVEGKADQFKAEEQRIAAARKVLENKAARVRQYIKDSMLAADITKLDAGTYKLSVAMTGGSVVIDDMEKIPALFKTITQTVSVDKNELKAAIKAGVLKEGAHIEAGFALKIR